MPMNKTIKTTLATLAVALSGAAWAQATDLADGEVRRVDRDGAKITLKHGDIKALDMPPMTMVFNVKDRGLLDTVKPGDRIRFRAMQEAGRYYVTEIQIAR